MRSMNLRKRRECAPARSHSTAPSASAPPPGRSARRPATRPGGPPPRADRACRARRSRGGGRQGGRPAGRVAAVAGGDLVEVDSVIAADDRSGRPGRRRAAARAGASPASIPVRGQRYALGMSSAPAASPNSTPASSTDPSLIKLVGLLLYLLVRRAGWTSLALAWCVASVLLSLKKNNWEWFARSGAVLTLAGAWLSGRAMWQGARAAKTDPHWTGAAVGVERAKVVAWNPDGQVSLQFDEETHKRWAANRRAARAAGTGVVLALVGTFIWGYGDWFVEWLLGLSK